VGGKPLFLDPWRACTALALLLAQPVHPLLGRAQRRFLVDDRRGVVLADAAPRQFLHRRRHGPGLGQVRQGHTRQLRHPQADEEPLRVLVLGLLGGRVHAQGVDPCGAALHLHLAPVDARLEVQKLARQEQPRLAPVQPQVVAGKTHQHRTHAEIQPARGAQGPHAGIDHRVAGAAFAPGGKAGFVEVVFAQAIARACEVAKLDLWLAFEFLCNCAKTGTADPTRTHSGKPRRARALRNSAKQASANSTCMVSHSGLCSHSGSITYRARASVCASACTRGS
jgi:hypothetical protein